jgi:seryl-tRNA synthetase
MRVYNLCFLSLKNKEDASALIAEKDSLNSEKERLTALEKEKEESLKATAATIGNIVHHSVITSLDEADNEIVRKWEPPADTESGDDGRKPIKRTGILSHHEVLYRIDGYDPERGKFLPTITYLYCKLTSYSSQLNRNKYCWSSRLFFDK